MKRIKQGLISTILLVMFQPFQSCSNDYKINTAGASTVGAQSTTGQQPDPTRPGDPNDTASTVNPPIPPSQIPPFSCQQYKILSLSDTMQIPARDASGTCYAIQLFQAIANGSSSLTTTIDDQVISRDHDGGNENPTITHHPYLMGQATVTLSFGDARNIKLTGAPDDTTPILVDNFVMVGFGAVADVSALTASNYLAYGTSDSTVNNTPDVLMDNQPVALTPFASGGTATVMPLDISQTLQVNQSYVLDVRAEDCGGSRQLSNVYLLIQ